MRKLSAPDLGECFRIEETHEAIIRWTISQRKYKMIYLVDLPKLLPIQGRRGGKGWSLRLREGTAKAGAFAYARRAKAGAFAYARHAPISAPHY
jgi:hypothetical protein